MLRITSERPLTKQGSLSAHEQTKQKIELYIEAALAVTFLNLIGFFKVKGFLVMVITVFVLVVPL